MMALKDVQADTRSDRDALTNAFVYFVSLGRAIGLKGVAVEASWAIIMSGLMLRRTMRANK